MKSTIAISTYQAGKVVFISSNGPNQLIQLPRNFTKAMGLALNGNRMAVATKDEVVILARSKGLAASYPSNPRAYDWLYVPRATFYTGEIDIHDMEWGQEGLYAVNTRFSCISIIDDEFSFRPIWKPNFVSDLTPDDRCHLNGMAMENGRPKYLTALGRSDQQKAWRSSVLNGGLLIDYQTHEIINDTLPMPHSPRLVNGKLYMLLSATGEVISMDPNSGKYDVIDRLDGFVRGLDIVGDYMFVGLSKLRQNSSVFRDLPIAQKALFSGVVIIHIPTGAQIGNIRYNASVEEIYDIKMVPDALRPGILNTEKEDFRDALSTPSDTYWKTDEPEKGMEGIIPNAPQQ